MNQFLCPHILEIVQQRAIWMTVGPENLSYEERLRHLGLFGLGKTRLRGDFINIYKYLWAGYQDEGHSLFLVMPSDRTSENRYKLEHKRFHFNMRRHFVMVRVMGHWNKLPRDVKEYPSLET